ncbi:hypothetical protein PC128_g10944 [Phytophthora cactorum]|nr:hypothetical protein PC128_g10944 [Phytophthora cactorum]
MPSNLPGPAGRHYRAKDMREVLLFSGEERACEKAMTMPQALSIGKKERMPMRSHCAKPPRPSLRHCQPAEREPPCHQGPAGAIAAVSVVKPTKPLRHRRCVIAAALRMKPVTPPNQQGRAGVVAAVPIT